MELRNDPSALAPERLLVFELRGSVASFAQAIRHVPGLDLVDEFDVEGDADDKNPVAYLLVPDASALRQMLSLWERWQRGEPPQRNFTAWRDVFALLRALRVWGPQDRVDPIDALTLADLAADSSGAEFLRLEVELVFRPRGGDRAEKEVAGTVEAQSGRVIATRRIEEIAYHAMLVDLPVGVVRDIAQHAATGILALDSVMYVRPQSLATSIDISDLEDRQPRQPGNNPGVPILALLDGVPVAADQRLARHLIVEDLFDLEPETLVADRVHGTAMASLIVHGDLNLQEAPLRRNIHVVPVMGARGWFPSDRLVIDLIHTAVEAMRGGGDPSAPDIVIVNLSVGNALRPFQGSMSAWARLLDRLAYRFGLLFVVSAGNRQEKFAIPGYGSLTAFEDADTDERARKVVAALGRIVADRRLLSPAETVNGLTVGALNSDAIPDTQRQAASRNIDPYGDRGMSNPSSTLGPGFANAVKPDVLFPGSREHLQVLGNPSHIEVRPARGSRFAGLKVVAPPRDGLVAADGWTNGTSAAAALASRTAHRIHDALELAYGEDFLSLGHLQRAVLLKALVAHTARWPEGGADLIRETIGPTDGRQHVRRKDNVRRFLGFGAVRPDDAVACAADRATFWACGTLGPDKRASVRVPVPVAISGKARPHAMFASLAWFTPVSPGRKSYRAVRLKLLEPGELGALSMTPAPDQPDTNQTNRGTLFMRRWEGSKAPVVGENMDVELFVQRDPDQGGPVDDPVPFGLAVTLTMPGVVEIYDQVRQRLDLRARARA
ncbi:MAG: S8 family peptidase [Pseudomonadota bacterium]|nr:S8 family peptidase [Pseudomonadota bacterium]